LKRLEEGCNPGSREFSHCRNTQRLPPIGLAEGCRLRRAIAKDEVLLGYDNIELASGASMRLVLRSEQNNYFSVSG